MKVELVKERKRNTTPNKLDCLSCGVCCYFPRFVGVTFNKKITIGEDGWCIHYDKEKKCTVHKHKPIGCKKYVSGGKDCIEKRELYLGKVEKE